MTEPLGQAILRTNRIIRFGRCGEMPLCMGRLFVVEIWSIVLCTRVAFGPSWWQWDGGFHGEEESRAGQRKNTATTGRSPLCPTRVCVCVSGEVRRLPRECLETTKLRVPCRRTKTKSWITVEGFELGARTLTTYVD